MFSYFQKIFVGIISSIINWINANSSVVQLIVKDRADKFVADDVKIKNALHCMIFLKNLSTVCLEPLQNAVHENT